MAKRPVPLYDFKAFGAAIKAARNEYGESRKKVSDELYISPRYLANIENKGQQPSLQVFYDLVTRYHISVSCRMVCFPCGALLFCSKNFLIAFCNACSVSLAAPFPTLTDRAIVFWVTSSCKVSTPFPVNCGYAHLLP